ncbi:hypothetical protein RFI_13954, partial [Reticulomyxa filosa]
MSMSASNSEATLSSPSLTFAPLIGAWLGTNVYSHNIIVKHFSLSGYRIWLQNACLIGIVGHVYDMLCLLKGKNNQKIDNFMLFYGWTPRTAATDSGQIVIHLLYKIPSFVCMCHMTYKMLKLQQDGQDKFSHYEKLGLLAWSLGIVALSKTDTNHPVLSTSWIINHTILHFFRHFALFYVFDL